MKNGEKFALLEEGRLSSYEQLNVMGGGTLVCKSDGIKTFKSGTTVNCPIKYKSCTGLFKNKLVCNLAGGYNGEPGSAGLVSTISADNYCTVDNE
jgi:hypothetical protein